MDTFRVQLPHPHPVANEEEFITNSGRKIKRPIVEVTPEPEQAASDMLGSGISVMSATPNDSLSARDDRLSNSVQAELHLSLDRLSENYDPDEFKRLQEKSKNSRMILTEREKRNSAQQKSEDTQEAHTETFGELRNDPISKDSLDAEGSLHALAGHQLELEDSEELVSGEEDEEHTVVGDSLTFSSSREGTALSSNESGRKISSTGTPVNSNTVSEDKYADLRYNPNWREREAQKVKPSPMVIDFNSAPRLDDSLEQPLSSHRGGGEIVVHKKGLYSPIIPEWGKEKLSFFNSRSVSPTRLSADPQKLVQTNARYEEEFNKMLKAEILNEGDELADRDADEQSLTDSLGKAGSPKKESYPVLIRKLESQDGSKRTPSVGFAEEVQQRIGGYQLLPDRHRIPSPSYGPSAQEMSASSPQRATKQSRSPGRYQTSPDGYYVEKKDPLLALSPRDKQRIPLAPTPPKVSKPKNVDFIELNKQRVGRKTNSAGYLEIHKKRFKQVEPEKSRSQSEIRRHVTKPQYGTGEMPSPDSEFPLGPVEGLWQTQAERLKITKGENVNKGKVLQPSQNTLQNRTRNGGTTFLVSPKQDQFWKDSFAESPRRNEWIEENQRQKRWDPSGPVIYQARHPLPIPSQQAPQPSPRRHTSHKTYMTDELMDSLHEAGFRRAYFSPRRNLPPNEEESPMMNAYHAKYSADVYEPTVLANRGNILRQNFSEQNLSLPSHETVVRPVDVWTNPDAENELPSFSTLPPSNHSHGRQTRKVTFLGDNEPVAIEGISNGDPIPTPPPGAMYRFNRHKIPLPPTPPSKSLRHGPSRGGHESEGKENEGYYDVREDHYPVLPPILKTHHKMTPLKQSPYNKNEETPKSDGKGKGSYLEQHEKQKKKFQYKIYTLDDYKNLKKDVKLGGLGPDLESARKKMEKTERAKKYAELIRKEHMANPAVIKPKEQFGSGTEILYYDDNYRFTTNIDEKQRKEMLEKRQRALEYSKKVPKPKPKQIPSPEHGDAKPSLSDYSLHQSPVDEPSETEGVDFNWGLLQMLKDRHEKEKAQVAAFTGNS